MSAEEGHQDARDKALLEGSGSFFMDGLTGLGIRPGEDIPLPASTDEFHFIKELGRGGMGVVYEVEEKRTGRHVAKVVSPQLLMSEAALARFEREAWNSAVLSHDLTQSGAFLGSPLYARYAL